jgi:hypothetical protein
VRPVLAAAIVILAAGCGGHGHKAVAPPKPKQAPIHVSLTADSHHPRVGKPWHYEVRVTSDGRPVPATVHLQILLGGAPVGQIGKHRVANGVWQETIGTDGNQPFPSEAKGIRLVFQATAKARGQTGKANWWIEVQ